VFVLGDTALQSNIITAEAVNYADRREKAKLSPDRLQVGRVRKVQAWT
jgi:hypothetical protein